MKPLTSLTKWLLPTAALGCAGCHSLPEPTSTWRGREDGRVEVVVVHAGPNLPVKAWLVESGRDGASGLVTFTKWAATGYRYHQRSYFTLEETWRAGIDHIGILKDGQFCTANPDRGGYQDGDSIVYTTSYDYCAGLVRD